MTIPKEGSHSGYCSGLLSRRSERGAWVRVPYLPPYALLAQLDRVPGYEPGGCTFESCTRRHYENSLVWPSPSGLRLEVVALASWVQIPSVTPKCFHGEMPEWLNGTAWKAAGSKGHLGSNPSFSAIFLGLAQPGQSSAFGTRRPRVQILHPRPFSCGQGRMVRHQPSKLWKRVRFPLPAPTIPPY